MKLNEFTNILQDYCHMGKSLDKVIIKYKEHILTFQSVTILPGKNEEDIIVELQDEKERE